MTHSIFGQRFATLRQPAWHGLGTVFQNEVGAVEALQTVGGDDINVTMEPVFVKLPDGRYVEDIDRRAAVRHPVPDDRQYRIFDVKGAEYEPVTLLDIAIIFDEFVAQPVETLGILGYGDRGFMTVRLPSIDVKGDDVEMYLGATYSFSGANTAEVWPLRVVCANTLRMAQGRAQAQYKIAHDRDAKVRMAEWLGVMYEESKAKVDLMRDVFNALANATATDGQARKVIDYAYPLPGRPRMDAPGHVIDKRQESYEYRAQRMQVRRDTALNMFKGAATGADTRAFKGSMYGVVQSVSEVENYRRGSFKGNETANAAEGVLFGDRGDAMIRAADKALELAAK